MLVLTVETGQFATNVHVIAPGPDRTCLIVDPGHRSAPVVDDIIEEHRLRPEAVLLTHGHMDHTWDAVPLARRYAVPTWIHPADRHQLGAPERGLPADFPPDLLRGHPHREPEPVRLLPSDGGTVGFETVAVTVLHTPGHTPGSVMFRIDDERDRPLLATGDTLLASGPGHSVAPGGDARHLTTSIHLVRDRCPAQTLLLTGHGPGTTLGEIEN